MERYNRTYDAVPLEPERENDNDADDDEPLITGSELEKVDEVRVHTKPSLPWQHRFGLIEIVQVTYFVSGVSAIPIMEQYLYARFLGNNTGLVMPKDQSTCEKNVTNMDYLSPEIMAQKETSKWMMMALAFSFLPAIITTYFWGVYSDLKGRKLPMICASFGGLIKFMVLLAVIKWDLSLYIFLLATVIDGCTGFFGTMLTCVYSYIADITPIGKARSRRLMGLEVFNGVFVALAQFGIGYFIRSAGFLYPIFVAACLQLINFIIIIFIVPETRKTISKKAKVFNLRTIQRTIRVFTKRSPKGRRTTLFIGIAAMILLDPALMTKRGVEVLYVLRSPLCWDSVMIGIFTSCSVIAQMTFVIVALRGLQLCLRDTVIAMLGSLSCTANAMFESFATTDSMMYIAAAMGLLSFMAPPLIKGLMSEKISADEQGSMFSGLVSVQFMFQGVGILALNAIYITTVAYMPGLVFMVIGVLSFCSFFLLGYLALKTSSSSPLHNNDLID